MMNVREIALGVAVFVLGLGCAYFALESGPANKTPQFLALVGKVAPAANELNPATVNGSCSISNASKYGVSVSPALVQSAKPAGLDTFPKAGSVEYVIVTAANGKSYRIYVSDPYPQGKRAGKGF